MILFAHHSTWGLVMSYNSHFLLQKLAGQHNALQKSHEELKKKLDASRARNQMLCGEVKMLKEQIGTLLEKGKHDDELIDALLVLYLLVPAPADQASFYR